VDLPALAVEELAQPHIPNCFVRLGTAFGIVFQRIDRGEKRVPPTVGRGLGVLGEPVVLFFDLSGSLPHNDDLKAHAFLTFFFCPSPWRNSRAGTVWPAAASAWAAPKNSIISTCSARASSR